MGYETILEPINGQEARKILKSLAAQGIDKIPMLSIGNAYKQISLGFVLKFSAFPPDCPVPSAEWQILMGVETGDDIEFDKDVKKLEFLREKKAELEANVAKIDKFLKKYNPSGTVEIIDSDNGVPDELRIAHGLKVPMLHTAPSGRKTEVLVNHGDIKK